jgi:putative endonuclease
LPDYYVYILTNRSKTLYTGVTNDLERRLFEHRHHLVRGFTAKYRVDRLVYFETTPNVLAAIAREKQIKGWTRRKKIALIESANAGWRDLCEEWNKCDSRTEILRPPASE